MQMAPLTTQSQLTASTAAEPNALVTAAIHQLVANQQMMQQQFTAFASTRNTTYQPATPAPPPMQQFTIQNLACSSLKDLELVEGKEDVDVASMLPMQDAKAIHHLLISLGAVARVACPPLEVGVEAVLRRLHNKMCYITRRQCIPTSSNGTQTGTFVSLAVLMLKMDIHLKHAQPPGDARITKRDTHALTLGSILWRDMTRAPRRCTSHSYQPCDGVGQNS